MTEVSSAPMSFAELALNKRVRKTTSALGNLDAGLRIYGHLLFGSHIEQVRMVYVGRWFRSRTETGPIVANALRATGLSEHQLVVLGMDGCQPISILIYFHGSKVNVSQSGCRGKIIQNNSNSLILFPV